MVGAPGALYGHLWDSSHHDAVVGGKAGYLNPSFFLVRLAIYFAAWIGMAFWFKKKSIEQDDSGDPGISLHLSRLAAPCILVYDWQTGGLIREMPMGGNDDGFAYDTQFHPDGFVMAASSAFPGKGHVWFWRPDEEAAFFSSNKLPNGRSLSLHPDGERIAFLSSISRNGNGRPLSDGAYVGGTAEIRFMSLQRS